MTRRIVDYQTLIEAAARRANREDQMSNMPEFVQFAEETILDALRVREGVVTNTFTLLGGEHPLPAGFISPVRLSYEGVCGDEVLSFVDENAINRDRPVNGNPEKFAIISNRMLFSPAPSDPVDIEFSYEADATPLTPTEPVNWIIQHYPHIYLYAVVAQIGQQIIDPEMIQLYTNLLGGAISGANNKREREGSGANLQMSGTIAPV